MQNDFLEPVIYIPQDTPSFASLAAAADKRFFSAIEARPDQCDHVLMRLLPLRS